MQGLELLIRRLESLVEESALQRGARSGRVAWLFARDDAGRLK